MAKHEIRAVELVRKIRDEMAAKLAGMSQDEVIEFFRKGGERARLRVKARRAGASAGAKRRPARKRK